MKIAFVWVPNRFHDIGGMLAHERGIAKGFVHEKSEVQLLTPFPETLSPEVTQVWLPHRVWQFPNQILATIAYCHLTFPKYLRLVRAFSPDFIYHRSMVFVDTGYRLKEALGLPMVLEYNSSVAWTIKNWLRGPKRLLGQLLLPAVVRHETRLLESADLIAVVSDVLKERLRADGISEERIIVCPNGVDEERFAPRPKHQALQSRLDLHGKTVVGFVATFGPWHGSETLAKAVASIAAKRSDIVVLFIGDGKLRKEAESIIETAGASSAARFVGKVPFKEIPDYLSVCDVVVNASEVADGEDFIGSPTKLFEYLACAKALVSTDVGQPGQLLSHEETALLIPQQNPDRMAKAIIRLADDSGLRQTLAENGRKFVLANYTWSHSARRILDAVKRLPARPGQARDGSFR